jgi:thioredoxin reductase (NADPH)
MRKEIFYMVTLNPEYDLLVIGGGPTGLTAAMTAESEGLNTLVTDAAGQFGGQAGTSSFIENYPGFPQGITGEELTSLLLDQGLKFNTEYLGHWRAESIERSANGLITRDDGESILARTVLLATGVQYRPLRVPNLAAYLGRGVTYGSPRLSDKYEGKRLCVIGGANSAGQASMHLSEQAECTVDMLVRAKSLSDKMSKYLVDRIVGTEKIRVHTGTEVTSVDGDGKLREMTVRTGDDVRTIEVDELFILIGAVPKTGWLPEIVVKDERGYVKSGSDIDEVARSKFLAENGRAPLPHETSMSGLFVAGDVRCGTTKRVVTSAADGVGAISDIHRYLEIQASKTPQ